MQLIFLFAIRFSNMGESQNSQFRHCDHQYFLELTESLGLCLQMPPKLKVHLLHYWHFYLQVELHLYHLINIYSNEFNSSMSLDLLYAFFFFFAIGLSSFFFLFDFDDFPKNTKQQHHINTTDELSSTKIIP